MVKKLKRNVKKRKEVAKKIKEKSLKKKIKAIKSLDKVEELKKDKSGLEESMEELEEDFDENKFVEFLQPSTESTSPVLEKVASADDLANLEQGLAVVQSSGSGEKEQENINYSTTEQSYDSIGKADEGEQRNNIPTYAGPSVDYSFEQDEKIEETRRFVGKGDMPQGRERRDRFEIEKQAFIKADRNTKKYISKGDYK